MHLFYRSMVLSGLPSARVGVRDSYLHMSMINAEAFSILNLNVCLIFCLFLDIPFYHIVASLCSQILLFLRLDQRNLGLCSFYRLANFLLSLIFFLFLKCSTKTRRRARRSQNAFALPRANRTMRCAQNQVNGRPDVSLGDAWQTEWKWKRVLPWRVTKDGIGPRAVKLAKHSNVSTNYL